MKEQPIDTGNEDAARDELAASKLHTPGPWSLHYPVGHDFHVSNTVYNVASILELNDLEEQEANAKLIVAAPEMLEALNTLYDLIKEGDLVRDISKDNDFLYFTNQAVRINNAIVSMNEAIKKATS